MFFVILNLCDGDLVSSKDSTSPNLLTGNTVDERIKNLIKTKKILDIAETKINLDIAIEDCHAVVFDQIWNETINVKNFVYDLEVQAGRFNFEKTYYATFSFIIRFENPSEIKRSLELKNEINGEIKKLVETYMQKVGGSFPKMFFRSVENPDFYSLYYLGTSGKMLTKEKSNFLHVALGLTIAENKNIELSDNALIGGSLDDFMIEVSDLGEFYSEGDTSIVIPRDISPNNQEYFDDVLGSVIQIIFMVELTNYEIYKNWKQIKDKALNFLQVTSKYYTAKRLYRIKDLMKKEETKNLYKEKTELDTIFSGTTMELGYIIESNALYNGIKSKEIVYDFIAAKAHLKDSLVEFSKAQKRLKGLIDEVNNQIGQLETEKMSYDNEKQIIVYEISAIIAVILSIISLLIKI